ncbi:DinB family protein [Paenibacillus amylolyticus]|uniref:DinB family protein n=1 Tax=Paenibacillus amylolyticus TaxID=1451 RepID=A0A5M9WPI0_PAEAM|nr:DinB family protein [Paenibacillus amylolyticus]
MIESAFKHIDTAVSSLVDICDQLSEEDLDLTPIEGKRSIRELLSHLALVCRADLYISEGSSEEEMTQFYQENCVCSVNQIKDSFIENRNFLYQRYMQFTTEELLHVTTSYWGASYSRLEWLLEMMGHMYHHRGQLYTMLTLTGREPKTAMFV